MPTTTVADKLRAWARGMYPTEAAVELLIRGRKAVYDGAPWIVDHGEIASIDVETLLYESGVWSSGEQRLVNVAASLLGGHPIELAEEVTGLDRTYLELVVAAIAHAGGSHESPVVITNEDGTASLARPGSLYPWPQE